MDHLLGPFLLILAAIVLLFAWLIWLSRGGRPVRVNFEGLGIKVSVDASPKIVTNKED